MIFLFLRGLNRSNQFGVTPFPSKSGEGAIAQATTGFKLMFSQTAHKYLLGGGLNTTDTVGIKRAERVHASWYGVARK